ncbi:10891_t:CDS:2 [Paraglomus occultum]|uniref:10891_t:CDS:1 n=1 Tax=Paraglomus occultum TaxID=144539 RepID=A0A9N9BTS6_9GLOM|nr:10891_t:CDS:2 [Paraglomus occultum]
MSAHAQSSTSTDNTRSTTSTTTNTKHKPPAVRFKSDFGTISNVSSSDSTLTDSPATSTTPLLSANAALQFSRPKVVTTPLRTTKTSQKLVLLPEQADKVSSDAAATREEEVEPQSPLVMRPSVDTWGRTDAERMSKEARQSRCPRVTAYCTADGYYLNRLMKFLRKEHNVHPRLYDECLYAQYFFPLTLGNSTLLCSSTSRKSSDGHSIMDKRIDQYEMQPGTSQYFDQYDTDECTNEACDQSTGSNNTTPNNYAIPSPELNIGEVFFFDYGVVVCWNLTNEQEIMLLRDLVTSGVLIRPLKEVIEPETFHFQYDFKSGRQPRIYNDMITLKSGNHMTKLTISHAISQSTKLTLYEWQMEDTIERTKPIPKMLAENGRLDLDRTTITKFTGEMYKLRMNVNLISNVLDTPEIFWSEPSLEPLYNAIRAYLEISQRTKILNERVNVISDLLDMLRKDIGVSNMRRITWIIIWLIVVAVFVAIGEIATKMLYLRK